MEANIKNRRRVSLQVEPLEGKALLSGGLASHYGAEHAVNAVAVAQAASLSGTLSGVYSNVHIPFAGYLLNYSTSGTLSGPGSTNLHGSIFVRGARQRAVGQFALHNTGGSMILRIFRTPTKNTYTYRVIRASGNDAALKGGTGTVAVVQNPTHNYPYFVSGQATMTFS